MSTDYAIQPDPETPEHIAKRLLRTEHHGQTDGLGKVAMASALTGMPLLHLSAETDRGANLTITIGDNPALRLTGKAVPLDDDTATHSAPRYVFRHGAPGGEGQYVVLNATEAVLIVEGQETALDPAALLTDGDGKLTAYERSAVDHMNDDHLDAVKSYAEVLLSAGAGEWRLASLDMEGLDLVRCDAAGTDFARLWFHPPLATPGDIKSKLVELAMAGRAG